MVPYLKWLKRTAHNRGDLGSSPSGTTIRAWPDVSGHGSCVLIVFLSVLYDHSRIRITHGKGYPSMCYSAILLSPASVN